MKHLIIAVAAAPLLLAAAPADAPSPEEDRRVLVFTPENGESGAPGSRVMVLRANDVEEIEIEGGRESRVLFRSGGADALSEEDRARLDAALDNLRQTLADLDLDRHALHMAMRETFADMGEHRRAMMIHAREIAEAAREHGEHARIRGMRAGRHGLEEGLRVMDEALERGMTWRGGEERAMTEEEREALRAARDRLSERQARMGEMRTERRAVMRRSGAGEGVRRTETTRSLHVEDRDGRIRVWINGEEQTGDDLTDWLNSEEGQRHLRQRPPAPTPPDRP